MKKAYLTLIFMIAASLIWGCSESNSLNPDENEEQLEQSAIEDIILDEENEYLLDWGIDDGNEDNMFNGFSTFNPGISFPKLMEPINNVVRFGRRIDRRFPRTVVIRRISPDSIMVHVERVLVGRFVIFETINDSAAHADTFAIYRKPLRHSIARNTLFLKQVNDAEALRDPRRRWKLSGISISSGQSRPENTVQIHQLTISTGSGATYEFSDPLQTLLSIPDDLPGFVQGESVTVQASVSNSSSNLVPDPQTGATETLLLHYGINHRHRARKMFDYIGVDPNTGFNLYEGSWTVHEPALRPFHAVVDAIDNGTIYETDPETYPYNSATWGFPYRVRLSD